MMCPLSVPREVPKIYHTDKSNSPNSSISKKHKCPERVIFKDPPMVKTISEGLKGYNKFHGIYPF